MWNNKIFDRITNHNFHFLVLHPAYPLVAVSHFRIRFYHEETSLESANVGHTRSFVCGRYGDENNKKENERKKYTTNTYQMESRYETLQ